MTKCAEWLDKGVPVMIFPEGTRSLDDTMLPFKDGAFRLALDPGAPILPVAVEGTREALPKHSWKFGCTRARVAVGTAIDPKGRELDELKALAREQIESLRRGLRGAAISPPPPAPEERSRPAAS